MKKKLVRLTEQDLHNIIHEAINELDWKTYTKAANKREAQGKHQNASALRQTAKQRFDDKFVGDLQYDTMGDKMKGKQSPKFQTHFETKTPSIEATNARGDKLIHHRVKGQDKHYDSKGVTTPEKFFKNKEVANAYNKARQELNTFNEQKLQAIVSETIKKVLKEGFGSNGNGAINGDLFGTSLNPTSEKLPKGFEKKELEDGTTIYTDQDFNEYTKDEYGKFHPLGEQKQLQESNELYDEWYQVEDYDGNTGNPGDYRSYELGHSYVDSAIENAKESGYDSLEDYLFYWLDEVKDGLPWYWSNDNAYKGERLFTHDGFTFYDLYGQLILDEYPVADARRDQEFEEKLKRGEYWTK